MAARAHGRATPLPRALSDWIASGGLMRLHTSALRDVRSLLVVGSNPAQAAEVIASRSVDFGIQQVYGHASDISCSSSTVGQHPTRSSAASSSGRAAAMGNGCLESGAETGDGGVVGKQRPELLQVVCGDGGEGGAYGMWPRHRGGRLRCRTLFIMNSGSKPVHLMNVTVVRCGLFVCFAFVCVQLRFVLITTKGRGPVSLLNITVGELLLDACSSRCTGWGRSGAEVHEHKRPVPV